MYTHHLVCQRCGNEFTKKILAKKSIAKNCPSCVIELGREANKKKLIKGEILANGTRRLMPDGYIIVKKDNKWIPEHRLIMQEIIKRPLKKGESVHHKNNIRNDNRVENLELWLSGIRYGQRATDICCPNCGSDYWSATMDGVS